jgi:mannosylglycerate hydrolase
MVAMKITSHVTLKKGSRKLDIKTIVDNIAENHRLRIAFPTGINAKSASASGHFTVDERPRSPVKGKDGRYWPEMQTLPMQHFIDVSDGKQGLALLNNCLTEYELKDDEKSTLYLTLFRSMGNMIATWWEAVGVFPKQKGSQMLRKLEFEYSLYPHEGDWSKGKVYSEAEKLNVRLAPYQVTPHSKGTLPLKHSFFSVAPENLIVSAFKKAEDRESCILRLYNPTNKEIKGNIKLYVPFKAAYITNLNEERFSKLNGDDSKNITISVDPNKITTIEMEF